ncbi:DUF5134 domain-containing protein [Nocardia sp. NPDC088792]|uniref:DUF5134 domain-containing protein n=1 Tax=Nocardia sp. NPDC088792 TaxID=3364332 RepID=UPI003827214A
MSNGVAGSVLAVMFSVMALFYGYRLVTVRERGEQVAEALRIVMCAAMVAMLGPWNAGVPTTLGIAVFTAAALFFVYRALFTTPRAGRHEHPRVDAVKMLAMVWMYVAMSPVATRPVTASADSSMTGMGGMDGMGGMSGMNMPGMGTASDSVPVPVWSATFSILVAVTVFGLGVWWHVRPAVRDRLSTAAGDRMLLLDDAVAALMTTGMAAAFLLLL